VTLLAGKVAIVTGAARGIGRGEATALAKEGAAVAVVDLLAEGASDTAEQIELAGGRAIALTCDVRVRSQVEQTVAAVVDAFGTVDILVNNAQIIPNPTPLELYTEAQLRDAYESGLLGTFHFMQVCFPILKAKGAGRIINTASASGHGTSVSGFSGYGAAKEAIRSLTKAAAREWGPHNINVNAISPSALSPGAAAAYSTPEAQAELLKAIGMPIARWSDPEQDVGRTVVFLAGPDSRQITGCTISVDGGLAMI
jgi:NAD(P)-dependent dehydrogenase (short-subunit alcohol dehydrogenase family)